MAQTDVPIVSPLHQEGRSLFSNLRFGNCEMTGLPSAADMAEAMKTGEDVQVSAGAGFLVINGLGNKLLTKDWSVSPNVAMAIIIG
jgi:hypothetical protein